MRRAGTFASTVFCIVGLMAAAPAAATEYVVDLGETAFLQEIDDQDAAGRALVDVEVIPTFFDGWQYSAVFKSLPSGQIHYKLRVPEAEWEAWLDQMDGLVGRWLDFEIDYFFPDILRSGIFWEGGGEDYARSIRSSNTDLEFQTLLDERYHSGMAIIDFEAFTDGNGDTRFGGMWVDGELQPRTHLYYGLTWEEVEDLLDPLNGRVVDLERYTDDQDRLRYGIILAMYPDGDSTVVEVMTATELADADTAANLIDLDSFEVIAGQRWYSGVWGDDWKSFREIDPYPISSPISLGAEIQSVISAFEATGAEMGLFAKSVYGDESIEYKADEPFYLASATKLAVHIRLWQLHETSGLLNLDTDTLQFGTSSPAPFGTVPWYVEERFDPGLSTGPCANIDLDLQISLRDLDAGMMQVSDNAATSMLVDDPTYGVGTWGVNLNQWLAGQSGIGRGWGLVTSIHDVDRLIMWQGQIGNDNDEPSYFRAPAAGLETIFRQRYAVCQIAGTRCGICGQGCTLPDTCGVQLDVWGDLTAYLQAEDPSWTAGSFPNCGLDANSNFVCATTAGYNRYYPMGVNSATPRAFGLLQEKFVTQQFLNEDNTRDALDMMTEFSPLRGGNMPAHITNVATKGGSKGGAMRPCTETAIYRIGQDAVVLNVLTKNFPSTSCTPVKSFLANPLGTGDSMGTIVLRRMTADLQAADPVVAAFAPTTIRPGLPFDVLVDVSNTGGIASGTFDVEFLATDGDVGSNDLTIGTVHLSSIPAGQTARARLTGVFPWMPEGTYTLGWSIDPPVTATPPDPDPKPWGDAGEFDETDNVGVLQNAVLTVLSPAPSCNDLDSDGFFDCDADCNPVGLTCGDCDDGNQFVNPSMIEVCNQLDDDCDGTADLGATVPVSTQVLRDPNPTTSDNFGSAIAPVGDLDEDGVVDFAIGQPFGDSPFAGDAGTVRVYSGASRELLCVAFDPDGAPFNQFGASIAEVGDLTGEGVPEFVVGNHGYDSGAYQGGAALVFTYDGATCELHDRLTDPTPEQSGLFGLAVGGPGDIDLDGTPDIAIGYPYEDGAGSDRGSIWLVSGDDGQVIRVLTDPASLDGDAIGRAIATPGDLNDDLIPDIVTAAPFRNSGSGVVLAFSGVDGSLIWTASNDAGSANDLLGFSVAALGDVTGDGVADIVAGEINGDAPVGTDPGGAVIFSGADGSDVLTLWDPDGDSYDDFGYIVDNAGDVDGDGWDDVVVGAPLHDDGADLSVGAVMVFSSQTGLKLLDLVDPASEPADELGTAVAGLGDLTGDGKWEIAGGARLADEIEANNAGRVLVWSLEADCDDDGVTPFDGDCDDQDSTRAAGLIEICDSEDNDCDGLIDEDGDGDTWGPCDDCDDADAQIHLGADERCNGLDDDCDTDVDEGNDADSDGYTDVCDCDDGDDTVNPGEQDLVCDGVDQDCNAVTDDAFDHPPGWLVLDRGTEAGPFDKLGIAVAAVGDLNSDGLDEIAAGVPGDNTVAGAAGAVAVFDGATGELHCLLTDPDGETQDGLGSSVAASADMSGDGIPDILAGVPGAELPLGNAGAVVVFSGADCTVYDKVFDPQGEGGDALGQAVASVGDLTGDGKPEYAAGAPFGNLPGLLNTGRVVVFDGALGTLMHRVDNMSPRTQDVFGSALSGGRDLDADGIPDFVAGAPTDDTRSGTNSGSLVAYSGATGEPIRKMIDPDGEASDELGRSVALIDDLNGDAVADILSGAINDDTGGTNAGAVIVFSGADGTVIDKAGYPETSAYAHLGRSIAAAPDVDGDGWADIVAGAEGDDEAGTGAGSVLLISGADLSLIRKLTLSPGQDGANLGTSTGAIADLTGDGMPEFLAGLPGQDTDGDQDAGQLAVFVLEADCDGDGVSPFGGDCDDADPDASGRPGDVAALQFTDKVNASWSPPTDPGGTVAGLAYDVIRSADASDFVTAADCVESDDSDTVVAVPSTPAVGTVLYYLVRAQNACDIGPAGYDSTLIERLARVCP